MTAGAKRVLHDGLELPKRQREEVVRGLIESLDQDERATTEEIEEAWAVEIKRRLDEIDSGKAKMIPGEQVLRPECQRNEQDGQVEMVVVIRRLARQAHE